MTIKGKASLQNLVELIKSDVNLKFRLKVSSNVII